MQHPPPPLTDGDDEIGDGREGALPSEDVARRAAVATLSGANTLAPWLAITSHV